MPNETLTERDVEVIREHIEKRLGHTIYCEEGLCVVPLPNDSELAFVLVADDGSFDTEKITWPISVQVVRDLKGEGRVYDFAQAHNVEDAKRIFDLIHSFCNCQ